MRVISRVLGPASLDGLDPMDAILTDRNELNYSDRPPRLKLPKCPQRRSRNRSKPRSKPVVVDGKIMSRHTANAILKQAGIKAKL